MKVIYEDNHILIVNKESGEIVQGDKTGDKSLLDDVGAFLKEKYNKQGNVFVGSVHRLDRPTTGLVIFAKTSKGLSKFSDCFRQNSIEKTYLAITEGSFEQEEGEFSDWLSKNEENNKSYVVDSGKGKLARLQYKLLDSSDNFNLYKVILFTGRHHQIRAQFAHRGVHIKGDIKYGYKRANDDRGISLHSYSLRFIHPINLKEIFVYDWPVTRSEKEKNLWDYFRSRVEGKI